jgi:tetratricopeptide (TPR) repeat protein
MATKQKQIVVIIIVVAMMGYLFSLPVKGLIKPKESRSSAGAKITEGRPVNTSINADYVSIAAKAAIGSNIAGQITALETSLKKAGNDADKLKLQKQLAQKWDDVNQAAPAAFYYQAIAGKQNTYQDWVTAGDRFNDGIRYTQDTVAQPALVLNAVSAFQNALKLNPDGLDAKTGLGIAYVNGGAPSPMQGISLLLEVVGKDPANRKANLSLGLFAIKSGQFQKGVDRFKGMIAVKPEFEPYFYLAECYKQLGQKKEAIDAYEKSKALMPDPAFTAQVDQYIKELKN